MSVKLNLLNTTVLVGIVLLLSSCAGGNVALDQSKISELRRAPVNVIYHGPIGPALQTAGDAIKFNFSLGVAGWGTPGLQLMGENEIDEPLVSVRDRLIERLQQDAGMAGLSRGNSPAPYDETGLEQMRERYGDGLHLQLIPGQWTIIYYVTSWDRYHMYYGVRARLVDTKNGTVLWSTYCQANQDDGDDAPDMDQLMANKAQRIKDWLDKATLQCANQLADKFVSR